MIYSKGIALLLSIIIVSIALAISFGVSNIVSTEISLSNTGRQSQLAFYAADAGVDCAIYLDTVHPGLAQSTFATSSPVTSNVISNACASDKIDVGGRDWCVDGANKDGLGNKITCSGTEDQRAGKSTFTLSFDNGSCAIVTVIRRQDAISNPTSIETFIHSDGYSSGAGSSGAGYASCSTNNSRVFQRSFETTSFGN